MLRGRVMTLIGRRVECGTLDHLVTAIRAGESRVLVVCGEPGVGKTTLLDYLSEQAAACRVVRATGVQSEMELAFAALHQLCAPMLGNLDHLPSPQREALRTAFGMRAGPVPDKFLIGLTVLNLLSDLAEQRPLVCVVDDEQWLDRASAQALGFVARRLVAESVGLVFAARIPSHDLAGLPELKVGGLQNLDARALLDAELTGPLDIGVRDLILAETRGNPLALLELSRGLKPEQLAGGFGFLDAAHPSERVEESFRRRIEGLPEQTRRLLVIAAADPVGDPALVWRAAARLGIGGEAAVPANQAGVVQLDTRSVSVIPSCVQRSTGRRRCKKGKACTGRWRRLPIRNTIPIDGPGIGHMPRPGPTTRSPPSWNASQTAPAPAEGSPPPRHSWNGRQC